MSKPTRYIFVMGGVLSGLGKGIAVSSVARMLQGYGYRLSAMKIDPYINVDAGTMNPTVHGETFITKDGLETDQDIGNYERFLQTELTRDSYMTSGQVFLSVIQKERNLEYRGKCVQPIPHIPEEVIRRVRHAAAVTKAEIMIIEIGGTVGEYENLLYLEAARMMHLKDPDRVQFILVSYLPIPKKIGEMKTKPTQHAVRALNSAGIDPDFLFCRAELPLDRPRKERLSIFCNMRPEDIISAPDVDCIYEVPVKYEREHLGEKILAKFNLPVRHRDLKEWKRLIARIHRLKNTVTVGIVGKYFSTGDFTLSDSYISVIESIRHACWSIGVEPNIRWINSEDFERSPSLLKTLEELDGMIVTGGFGTRGINGEISAIRYARTKSIPYLGLCYGMQLAVIEFARNVAGLHSANSTEIDPETPYPVVDMLPEQREKLAKKDYGGTMRLGEYRCALVRGSIAYQSYGKKMVYERHRHRYEINNEIIKKLIKKGLVVSGVNPERGLIEIIEIPDHPFFLGTQFHPELKSYPLQPHPILTAFSHASRKRMKSRKT